MTVIDPHKLQIATINNRIFRFEDCVFYIAEQFEKNLDMVKVKALFPLIAAYWRYIKTQYPDWDWGVFLTDDGVEFMGDKDENSQDFPDNSITKTMVVVIWWENLTDNKCELCPISDCTDRRKSAPTTSTPLRLPGSTDYVN